MPTLLEFSRELASIAQAGLTYTKDPFDKERFTRLRAMASELLQLSNPKCPDFEWPQEIGYSTPKVDVRAVVFREEEILLVKERSSKKWTLPGGWADVNKTLRENGEKECLEETGYHVQARAIVSVVDMERSGYPQQLHSIYKIFLLCDLISGKPIVNIEVSEIAFHSIHDLPELDPNRASKEDILRAYEHFLNPQLPTYFN